ncbi:MAG: hypothetical protein U9N34_08670, partial [Candidatus Cloacimonadota bacterium]|nr:hypothetical protein [Candidatus Cloacimonadota bacterium]
EFKQTYLDAVEKDIVIIFFVFRFSTVKPFTIETAKESIESAIAINIIEKIFISNIMFLHFSD